MGTEHDTEASDDAGTGDDAGAGGRGGGEERRNLPKKRRARALLRVGACSVVSWGSCCTELDGPLALPPGAALRFESEAERKGRDRY